MRLAILGGSFNPIHLGHLFLADAVLSHLRYDRVVLVPAYRSPFKLAAADMGGNARDRLEMIAASISGDPRLTVDECEIRREGVSYTVDTVKDIIRRYALEEKPALIIGDDLAADFPQWHNSGEILAMADIIIARRIHSEKLSVPYPSLQITNDVMEISSGMVREKIAQDADWRYLVPAAARNIIENRGLYGLAGVVHSGGAASNGASTGAEAANNIILRVEEAARRTLSLERFLHSRNTALLAWDMCRRLSADRSLTGKLDPQMGYLAGIAHDLAKPLNNEEMLKLAKTDGKKISSLEKEKPSLLHGRVAAILLKECFDVNNDAVLEAVALHTGGGEHMCPLAKVIYIADKMEFSRDKVEPFIRKLVYSSDNLDHIFITVLQQNVSSLQSRKIKLSDDTERLLERIKKTHGEGL